MAADTAEAVHILAWDIRDTLVDRGQTVAALVAAAAAILAAGTALVVELGPCSPAVVDSV